MPDYLNHPPRWLLAVYTVAIAAMWMLLSTSDYHEARKLECANRSTPAYSVEWDSVNDKCVKEKRNGTSAQNR